MSDIKTKFINDPEQITPELLEGYVLAYPDQVKLGGENIVVRANPKSEDKVAIVTLGGSGHEPALSGFVGEGMLDCSVVGDIFSALSVRTAPQLRHLKTPAILVMLFGLLHQNARRFRLVNPMCNTEAGFSRPIVWVEKSVHALVSGVELEYLLPGVVYRRHDKLS